MNDLPSDLLVCIALNLSIQDLARLGCTAQIFRICFSDKVWKKLCQRRFPKYCTSQLPDGVSYQRYYRELTQAHKLPSNHNKIIFKDKDPNFNQYGCMSFIYPVAPFVVCPGGNAIYTDLYIEQIPDKPFLVISQSKRETIIQCQVVVGETTPRVTLEDIPDNDDYKKKLNFHNAFLAHNELIHKDHLPQLLAEAREKGYKNVGSLMIYNYVRESHLIKYQSLFRFTRHNPVAK